MISDIRVNVLLRRHRKRRKLEKLLGPGAIGYLIDLWIATGVSRPDGILVGWSPQDIADEVDWSGDPEQLLLSFKEAGWIDRRDDGTVIVHDWAVHQGWATTSSARSNKARMNALLRHHSDEEAYRLAREKYGFDPSDYGYVLPHAVADANGCNGNATALQPHATADATACDGNATAVRPHKPASAPSPSPQPSPPQKNDSKESGSAGSPRSRKRHFSSSAPEYAESIKKGCSKVKALSNGSGRFNPFQWAQVQINKAGHPQAVVDTLDGLVQYWESIRGEPWAWADKVMKSKSGNYYERDEAAKAQGYKALLGELAQLLGNLPAIGSGAGPSGAS